MGAKVRFMWVVQPFNIFANWVELIPFLMMKTLCKKFVLIFFTIGIQLPYSRATLIFILMKTCCIAFSIRNHQFFLLERNISSLLSRVGHDFLLKISKFSDKDIAHVIIQKIGCWNNATSKLVALFLPIYRIFQRCLNMDFRLYALLACWNE